MVEMKRETILQFATAAHSGQKRKDGKDYITHPMAVAEIALKWFGSHTSSEYEFLTGDIIYATCLLHDVLEDTNASEADIEDALMDALFAVEDQFKIEQAVKLLTRPSKEVQIIDYLCKIKGNPLAKIVKLADLEHNMSDLKPGNLLDKYQLCKYFLSS